MADIKIPTINPNAAVNDVTISINGGEAIPGQAKVVINHAPSTDSEGQPWPPKAEAASPPSEPQTDTPRQPSKGTGTRVLKQGFRVVKNVGKGAANGMSNMADKVLDLPPMEPLREFKLAGKILIFIMFGLLVISILCFFRKAILWGVLGLLVDVAVAAGLISYFGISFKTLLTKFFVYAAVGVTGAMLLFCFVRMIMGR